MNYFFISDTVLTLLFACIITLFIEIPFINLEKIIFSKIHTNSDSKSEKNGQDN